MTEDRELPVEISQRLGAWQRLWWRSAASHYALGILGVTCSAIATTNIKYVTQTAAVIAAVCFAVIGFVNPQRRYSKFVRAWRILDSEVDRYRYLGGTIESLFAAKERGEEIITEVEQETAKPTKKPVSVPSANDA